MREMKQIGVGEKITSDKKEMRQAKKGVGKGSNKFVCLSVMMILSCSPYCLSCSPYGLFARILRVLSLTFNEFILRPNTNYSF